jgi:MSHA biogenesis protein MshO
MRAARAQRGFTLAEAVIVIAITGVIAAVVAVFIRKPIEGYFDSVRRAGLTDTADVALRRMGRDLRTALPNSVRVTQAGSVFTLQYIETTGGGRYRSAVTSTGTGNALDFSAADTTFEVLGPAPVAATGSVVVGNLGAGTGADAYAGNSSALTAAAGSTISMNSIQFPVESPGKRFQITGPTVTYVCPGPGNTLMRGASMLASNVTGCNIGYDTFAAATRSGVVSIWLTLAQGGESVTLFHQVHVVNTP